MIRRNTLVLSHEVAGLLRAHLFPGDGLEAAALLLCSQVGTRRTKLLAREVMPVPHHLCERSRDFLRWPGELVEEAIDRAAIRGDVIIAIHSHPGGLFAFSTADDESDRILLRSLRHGTERIAGSAIMIPGGAVRARLYNLKDAFEPIDLVTMADANRIACWRPTGQTMGPLPIPLPFTSGMREWLAGLSVCIIGVSGTGSIVAEQLARLGAGEVILIDFDKLEERNLNRILNSTRADLGAHKVEMFANAIRRYNPECEVISVPASIATRDAVLAASEADILFSCVDSAEGRHIAGRMCAYFTMPLFDVGVAIPTRAKADRSRQIEEVYGRVDYVFPGGSTLLDRGVYDAKLLEAEYLAKVAPQTLKQRIAEGYIQGLAEEAPGVITLNMRAASVCVMEFIARLCPFRNFANEERARTIFMLAEGDEDIFSENRFAKGAGIAVAAGIEEPLLGLPALSPKRKVA